MNNGLNPFSLAASVLKFYNYERWLSVKIVESKIMLPVTFAIAMSENDPMPHNYIKCQAKVYIYSTSVFPFHAI